MRDYGLFHFVYGFFQFSQPCNPPIFSSAQG